MTRELVGAALVVSVVGLLCAWLFRCRHELFMVLRRDAKGRATGVIDWTCFRCRRVLGTTGSQRKTTLLVDLRRQWAEMRGRIRRAA